MTVNEERGELKATFKKERFNKDRSFENAQFVRYTATILTKE